MRERQIDFDLRFGKSMNVTTEGEEKERKKTQELNCLLTFLTHVSHARVYLIDTQLLSLAGFF